jgi:hypothetical protein
MNYHITRGDQSYGPYTLADLQRYVASGHVLPSDLARSEEMTEWVPVSQILNPAGLPPAFEPPPAFGGGAPPASPYQSGYAQTPGYPSQAPGYAPGALPSAFEDPPNLNWGLVLLFDFLTCGVFQLVWNFILSAWMKRVQPASQAIIYYAVGYGLQLINTGFSIPIFLAAMHHTNLSHHYGLNLLSFVAWVIRIFARFNMKSSLEEHFNTVEPLGLRLNGVMVFFFGGLYLQSQMNRINEIKQAMRYRGFAA